MQDSTRGYLATTGPEGADSAAPMPPGFADATAPDPRTGAGSGPHAVPAVLPAQRTDLPTPSSGPRPLPRPAHTITLRGQIPEPMTSTHLVSVSYEAPPATVVYALALRPSAAHILVRRQVIADPTGRIALEIRTSYTPGVYPDSPLAQSQPIPGPWPDALAVHLNLRPATSRTDVTAHHPTPYQASILNLDSTAIVLVRDVTLYTTHGDPIDHTVSVWPADSTRITDTAPANS
ncbi:UTRA domain-containing protein [Actinomadura parmotrematis]|uniref:UTRA domain-containing protein n=1 Tax=Actinomadura parmotrematis TaxID=2864039 RepID=UPI0027E3417B|nr:UTRA domain-containing protein [Actinomadura parmotrematis]